MFDSKHFTLTQQFKVVQCWMSFRSATFGGSKMPQIEARKVATRKILSNKGQTSKSKSILTQLKDLKTKLENDNKSEKSDGELNICGNCGGDISKQRYY